jgi:hypothetical protein
MDSMRKDELHLFKRLVPGHPYCVEGLRPWESGISCGRLEHDPIHQAGRAVCMDINDCTHGDGCPVHPDTHAVHNFDADALEHGYQREIESLTARMAAALVQLKHLRAEVSVVTVVPGHDDRSRFRESVDKITKTLTLPTTARAEQLAVREANDKMSRLNAQIVEALTLPAAPSTTPAETDAEYDARREAEQPDPLNVVRGIVAGYVPNGEESYAIAMRCLRELDAQRHTTPAEARTGISDRAAAALADIAEIGRVLYASGVDPAWFESLLSRIEQALRADGAA